MAKAVVQLITTGGTIASKIDLATGATLPAIGPAELLAQVPLLSEVADIRVEDFGLIPSWNLTPAIIAVLARRVKAILDGGAVAGLVVTHGTDTMEETAFALDLLLDEAAPVVFTGAMRNASQPGADGPRNLFSAVRVASDAKARGLGVLLAMNDFVHSARYVTKRHTTALDAFASPNVAPVGLVDDAGFWLHWRPASMPHLPIIEPELRVYLVKMAAGADDLFLRAALANGARGVVIEGSGAGNVTSDWLDGIGALVRAGVPVVLVSRAGAGRVLPSYGASGGGRMLKDMGVIPGGYLSGLKARLALIFALGAGRSNDDIRSFFAAFN